ncbi:MAG: FumA C-terminus/TtdB family hydratase beta subunit [Candidatus Omnitrophica bacterium]|nr:FumA C-terminus/TtdB family hydratase beta subunit [Candidatus Omnitrophota bacterium]MBU1932599.1 FumA C-terminus/TtdB family hydratase beta subunit [Candidatus Omnitrophota bacterium]
MRKIYLPLKKEVIRKLRQGEEVLLDGPVLTSRDAAHKRLVETIKSGKRPPVSIKGETIYYTGPTPTRPGETIGSCGPTTSSRMDSFVPILLRHGLVGMIGKGERSLEVKKAIKKAGAVYFVTIGGAGAYLSEKVIENKIIAYEDLGTEAIRRLVIKDFPAIVSIV